MQGTTTTKQARDSAVSSHDRRLTKALASAQTMAWLGGIAMQGESNVPTLAIFADTRMRHEALTVPRATVYVHAGQWSTTRSWNDTLRFLDWFKALAGMKVLVRGPSDACASPQGGIRDACAARGVVYLENERATVAGLTFWGGPWVDEEPLPQLGAALAPVPDRVDVLVTHGAPRTEPAAPPTHRDRAAVTLLAEVIAKRPRLHVFARGRRGTGIWGAGPNTTRFVGASLWRPIFGLRSPFVERIESASASPA